MLINSAQEQHDELGKKIVQELKETFPIEDSKGQFEVHVKGIKVGKGAEDVDDIKGQLAARTEGKTWASPITATLQIKDKATGEVLMERPNHTIGSVPRTTRHYTYIVGGKEKSLSNQWRLRPGAYVKPTGKPDEVRAQFQLAKGPAFKIDMDPKSGDTWMSIKGRKIPMYSVLKYQGVTDQQMEDAWGKDIFDTAKKKSDPENNIRSLYEVWKGRGLAKNADLTQATKELFSNTKLDADIAERNLGVRSSKVNGSMLLAATKKIHDVGAGTVRPDPIDSLEYKELWTPGDHIADRIRLSRENIRNRVTKSLSKPSVQKAIRDKDPNVLRDVFLPDLVRKPIYGVFATSLANSSGQTNPISLLGDRTSTTISGPGGITNANAISESNTAIDPSHMGFIDPTYTPEGDPGATTHLAAGVTVKDRKPYVKMFNMKTGKPELVDAAKAARSTVVLPDQVTWRNGKPVPIKSNVRVNDRTGEIKDGKWGDAEYVLPDAGQVFSAETNLVPFMQNDSAGRTTMSARHMAQAISITGREAPLVQSVAGRKSGRTYEEHIGSTFMGHKAKVDGEVVSVKKDEIVIKGKDGKKHTTQIYDHYPLNDAKAQVHSTPLVKVGDKVRADQTIADNSFTKDGTLALGTNLRTAYLASGTNHEDGITISESAARKLSSEHLYKPSLYLGDGIKMGKKSFLSHRYADFDKAKYDNIGDDGVIAVGTKVKPGDPLVLALNEVALPQGADERARRRLQKRFRDRFTSAAQTWDSDHEGEVVRVARSGKDVVVHVKTVEPMQIGSKLSTRHAAKGLVAEIRPDELMPHDEKGTPVQVMINPASVVGRMNTGQILETAAGKIAEKTGKPYKVKNFETGVDYLEQVRKDLKSHGLKETETLTDPTTGRKMKDITVGPHYLIQLKHQIDKKTQARGGGWIPQEAGATPLLYDVDNQQPKGGGKSGAQSLGTLGMYGAIASGLKHNLQEMSTLKSDSDQAADAWDALTNGTPLPTPKVPFAYKKFENLLRGAGINLEKSGNEIQLTPQTDKQVLASSMGELSRPNLTVRAKDDAPMKGGLYDYEKTGGPQGKHWSHITLAEPMPNPVFAKPVEQLLGLKHGELSKVISGESKLANGKFGGKAIKDALAKVDVQKELDATYKLLHDPKTKDSEVTKLHDKYRALKLLSDKKLKADEAYTMKHVPVLPPVMRPMTRLVDGTSKISPTTDLYRRLGIVNQSLKSGDSKVPYDTNTDTRLGLYQELENLMGTTAKGSQASSLDVRGTQEDPKKKLPGILHMIHGTQPKTGFFQSKVLGKRMDYTARVAITGDPSLSMDEIGVPKKVAAELYRPMVTRRLIQAGYDPIEAHKMISQKDPVAMKHLQKEVEERPVLMKRDPVLHQHSILGQNIRLTDSPSVKVSPLVLPPLGGDFDGDSCIGNVLIRVSNPKFRCRYKSEAMVLLQELGIHAPNMEELAMAFVRGTKISAGEKGQWISIDIANFPRIGKPRKNERGNLYYEVPRGVQVMALGTDPNEAVQPYEVSEFSVHPNLELVKVTTSSGRTVECSKDHSLFCMDPSTMELRKAVPGEARGWMVPRPKKFASCADPIEVLDISEMGGPKGRLASEIDLDEDFGWAIGMLAGDGWVSGNGDDLAQVCCSKGQHEGIRVRLTRTLQRLVPDLHEGHTRTGYGVERGSENIKLTYCCAELAYVIEDLIGKGAENKHLPDFFLETTEEFRRGLLSGLIDSDGSVSHDKNDRFSVLYTTKSQELADHIALLATSLGVRTGCGTYTKERRRHKDLEPVIDGPYYNMSFWTQDLQPLPLTLSMEKKAEAFSQLQAKTFKPSSQSMKLDMVPMSPDLANHLSKIGANRLGGTMYAALRKIAKQGLCWTNRYYATTLILDYKEEILSHEHGRNFIDVCSNSDVTWDRIDLVESSGGKIEMYDLTVPGPYTFMLSNQVIVWDTVTLMAPLSKAAIEETRRVLPSARPINPSSGEVVSVPANESALSLYRMSIPRGEYKGKIRDAKHAEELFYQNKLDLNQKIHIPGIGKTTLGRVRTAEVVPDKYRKDVLTNLDKPLDRSWQKSVAQDLAKNGSPAKFRDTVDQMSQLGFKMAYESGHSVTMKDITPQRKLRDKIINTAAPKAKALFDKGDQEGSTEVWLDATRKLHNAYGSHYAKHPTNVSDMAVSGIKAKREQFQGTLMAPMLVQDHQGNPSKAPITKSFSEGVDLGGYFLQASGARRGLLQKVKATSRPGFFSKNLMHVNEDQNISSKDCGTTQGILLSVKDRDVVDRYTSGPISIKGKSIRAGTLVTPEIARDLAAANVGKVPVRSPLKCRMPQGVCAKCMGRHSAGRDYEEGEPAGIVSAHAIGERATQLMLKQTHGAGIVSTDPQELDEFDRVEALFSARPKNERNAQLASGSGSVVSILKRPTGGWDIKTDVGGKAQNIYSRQPPLPAVKAGYQFKKGDPLSSGDPHMSDILKTQGHSAMQNQMASTVGDIYSKAGVLRRHAELTVRNSTSLMKVTDPGSYPGFVRGDRVKKQVIDELNRTELKNGKPIKADPVMTSIEMQPLRGQPDWMARLGGSRISTTLQRAAQQGHKTLFGGDHPVPTLARGGLLGNIFGWRK